VGHASEAAQQSRARSVVFVSQRLWHWGRWLPAVLLFGLGLLDAMHWTRGRPSGCAYLMSDADTIEQIGASWFPPSVTCRFTSFQYEWIERQHAWGYYLPVALFVAAACCAWYAIRHRTPYGHLPGPWWQPVALAATLSFSWCSR
jgi:hypothetical protein